MKTILDADDLTTYPNHNVPFHIYTCAPNYQKGTIIIQFKSLVAHQSKALSDTQQNYYTIKKQLISIVMVIKTFHSVIFGA